MASDLQMPMVTRASSQISYAVNTMAMKEILQKQHLKAAISEILGASAHRIFCILLEYKKMEQQQVNIFNIYF